MPLAVLVLGLGAGVAIAALFLEADESRRAQLEISALRLKLEDLRSAAFRADPKSGGSPAVAREQIRTSNEGIRKSVRYLTKDGSAPEELNGLGSAVRQLNPIINEIFIIGAFRGGYGQSARVDVLRATLTDEKAKIVDRLDRAAEDYGEAAWRSRTDALIGSAVTLMLLLGAFLFLYGRSAQAHGRAIQARLRAESLASENERLWQASRDDSITDELTGLRNRRALHQDFQELLTRSKAEGENETMLAMFDLDGFKQYNDTFGHGAGDALLNRLGERLAKAMGDKAGCYRMGGDEFCIVATVDTIDGGRLVDEAVEALSAAGDGWKIGCSHGIVWLFSEAADMADALRMADQRMYANKASRASAGRQTAAALLQVLVEQGDGLDGHAGAVAELSVLTAKELGVAPHELHQIELAAELHDIGKAAVPDSILNKPGKLDDAEWEFVRRHTVIGERIILAAPSLDGVARIVRSSHERVDGRGYPDGLAGDQIPVGSRVIAVTDAFHAMVSQRPYGDAISSGDAIAELQRCAGTQFDEEVVAAFLAVLEQRDLSTTQPPPTGEAVVSSSRSATVVRS